MQIQPFYSKIKGTCQHWSFYIIVRLDSKAQNSKQQFSLSFALSWRYHCISSEFAIILIRFCSLSSMQHLFKVFCRIFSVPCRQAKVTSSFALQNHFMNALPVNNPFRNRRMYNNYLDRFPDCIPVNPVAFSSCDIYFFK